MQGVAATAVTPRFRMLAASEIAEKSAGEVVTSVDRAAERLLYEGLELLGIPARIVGEEAAEHRPELLDGIGEGLVWLVDPLDGTANFAAGRAPFGMMVALVEDGVPLAGWILDPLSGRLCHAERGAGATCDGTPVRSRPTGGAMPVAALGTHFMTPERRAHVHEIAAERFELVPVPRCAAESYPRLALGQNDLVLFQRTLPWDHAAGALFLTEAGGVVTDWAGTPYRVGSGRGILAAADERLWAAGAELLLGPTAGLIEREDCTT
ncbi:inositol monophosphatase family protein [Sphingomonas sp. ZT3P38]|uniref:inositol monophosphatase family protein n=1 Tax=Parasphingomonas zepuensis TaxID=3096161 RepID=UPI002FC9587C